MNVLIVGHAQIRDVNRDVYRALSRLGSRVTLLVPKRWSSAYGTIDVEPAPNGELDVIARPIAGRHHSNMYWFKEGIGPAAASCAPDAIYVDEDPASFAAFQAARVARRRNIGLVVLAVQNIFKRYPPPFASIQRSVFSAASAAVTNSREATETLRRRGYAGPFYRKPLTSDVRPLDGAERTATRERYGIRATTFGFVGRLVKEKGVDVFFDALARMPDGRGIVVGEGPERAQLIARAERLGIADRVRFTGPLDPAEASNVIGAIDALVLPSLTMKNWSEQFGRVLVEAMAAGTPVIASASGAIPEVLGDAGILVPEARSDELARAMMRLLDAGTAADFARRGLERASTLYSSRAAAMELDRALRHTPIGAAP